MSTPAIYTDQLSTDQFGDHPTRIGEKTQANLHRAPSGKSSASSVYTTGNRLTYVDEDFNYNPGRHGQPLKDTPEASLVQNAADVGRVGSYQDLGKYISLQMIILRCA